MTPWAFKGIAPRLEDAVEVARLSGDSGSSSRTDRSTARVPRW